MLFFIAVLIAGGVAYNLSGPLMWVGVAYAVAILLLPLYIGVEWFMDHTVVTGFIQNTWLEMSGADSFNHLIGGAVNHRCPDGSVDNPSGSLIDVFIAFGMVPLLFAFGLAVCLFLLSALPAAFYSVAMAGGYLILKRERDLLQQSFLAAGYLVSGTLAIGVIIRLINTVYLAIDGCL